MRREGTVAGVLLAAGSSTRMGRNKMLLELDGETVLRRAAQDAVSAGLDPVVVVTGYEHELAEAQIGGIDCVPVHNGNHEAGIHTSVHAGIDNLPDTVGAAIIILADMPFVTGDMLRGLVERYRNSDAVLVISRYGGAVNAPPMLYDRSLFGELRAIQQHCGREVVKRHRDEALELDWPRAALADIDTPEDYDRVREELAMAGEKPA